jgi:hypothetical protein
MVSRTTAAERENAAPGLRRGRLVNHGLLAAEHPMIAVDALDAHPGLVAGDAVGLAQNRERLITLVLESRRGAREHVQQRALAQRQAEQIVQQPLQALIGERLQALAISGERVREGAGRTASPRLRDRRRGGAGAFVAPPQPAQWIAKRRCRRTKGRTGGISISS